MKQSIQNGVKMLRHLGSVCKLSLVEIGRQAGREDGLKIDPKRHRASDEKWKAPRWPRGASN